MKTNKLDLFKISIIVILVGFLYCFHLYTQNGRYVRVDNPNVVLDSRTGKLISFKKHKTTTSD